MNTSGQITKPPNIADGYRGSKAPQRLWGDLNSSLVGGGSSWWLVAGDAGGSKCRQSANTDINSDPHKEPNYPPSVASDRWP